jgi:tyrosinase
MNSISFDPFELLTMLALLCRRTLSTKEKHEYIDAVKCLARKPSQTGHIYAGAKSRFDDFQVSHIVNTDFIHYVVSL